MRNIFILVVCLVSSVFTQIIMWEKTIPFETADDGPVGIDVSSNGDIMVACYTNGPNYSVWLADSLISSPETKIIQLDTGGNFISSNLFGHLFNNGVKGIGCFETGYYLLGNTALSEYTGHKALSIQSENDSLDTTEYDGRQIQFLKADQLNIPVAVLRSLTSLPGSKNFDELYNIPSGEPYELQFDFPDSVLYNPDYQYVQLLRIDDFSFSNNGDLFITGVIGGQNVLNTQQSFIMKFDSSGALYWQLFNVAHTYPIQKVAACPDGGCFASMMSESRDYHIVRYDIDGNVTYTYGKYSSAFSVFHRISDNEYIGKTYNSNEIFKFTDAGSDISIDWTCNFAGICTVRPAGNGFIAAGVKDNNIWIAKVDATTEIEDGSTPLKFELHQNYPNPFNPVTTIRYSLPAEADVKLTLFDISGREVVGLVSGRQGKGNHSVNFNAEDLTSGMYIYSLKVDGKTVQSRKMMMIK
jgi:hypothetical protein